MNVADDADHIHAILQQRKREREEMIKGEEPAQPPCDVEQKPLEDYACGLGLGGAWPLPRGG